MTEFDAILAVGATTVLLLGAISGYVQQPALDFGTLDLSRGRPGVQSAMA
jgi:hypothetical protein